MKNQKLRDFAKVCIEGGLKCYTTSPDKDFAYFTFTDGEKIAYCQTNFYGISFSKVVIPSRNTGSGCRLFEDTEDGIIFNPDIKTARTALISMPDWYRRKNPELYKDWDDYVKRRSPKVLEIREITIEELAGEEETFTLRRK